MHAVLARAYRRTMGEDGIDPTLELLREEVASMKPRGRLLARWHEGLWETERALLAAWSEAFPAQAATYRSDFGSNWDEGPSTSQLEAAFGYRTPEEEDEVVHRDDRPDAARFPNRPDGVPVTGRIDRLDVGTIEGETAYNIVDYKTGSSLPKFAAEQIAGGTSLQLALYAIAAKRCGLVPADAVARFLVYWGVKEEGPKNGVSNGRKKCVEELLPTLEDDLDAIVPRLAEAIRGGVFPISPEKAETQVFSDHARVGRAAEVRAVAERLEKWPPPWHPAAEESDDDE
ncbi:ATP-dependent helicase/deoxyribonuclease subunit B [Planctomycetes bacterium LzC2]|uniref:ATP-dependent helicase/deoxyribonuclease subunit B n=2 Tax=Alienimonas chondri TaxID=2681879 RepID=A0ABX1VIE4_9PLAN|nr:ATP-dependent helicase/deoxyribonuclease subunit B [Alienimonas chondri]